MTTITQAGTPEFTILHGCAFVDGEFRETTRLVPKTEFDDLFRQTAAAPGCVAWTTSREEARATPGARWVRTRPQQPRRLRPTPRESRPAHRSSRRSTGTAGSRGDPPADSGGDGDSDADPDPVEVRVRQLVDQAPPLSPGQRALLGRLLGGGAR